MTSSDASTGWESGDSTATDRPASQRWGAEHAMTPFEALDLLFTWAMESSSPDRIDAEQWVTVIASQLREVDRLRSLWPTNGVDEDTNVHQLIKNHRAWTKTANDKNDELRAERDALTREVEQLRAGRDQWWDVVGGQKQTMQDEINRLHAGQAALLHTCDLIARRNPQIPQTLDIDEVRAMLGAADPTPKAGDRVQDGGQWGTLIRCPQCDGDGLLHQLDPDELARMAATAPAPEPEPVESRSHCSCGRALPCRHCTQETT